MKIFLAFVTKEFRHVLRDTRSLIIIIGMPVAMLLIFGFALSNEVKNARIAVLDEAKDEYSKALIQRFHASAYLEVVQMIEHPEKIDALFRAGTVKMVVVIPPHFSRQLVKENKSSIQLITDASDANTASTIANYASSIIMDTQREWNEAATLPYTIKTTPHLLYNPQLKSAYNFVPGVMVLILILLSAMLTAVAIVKEKETGTMELVLVSPAHPMVMIISKAIPYLLVGILDVIIILLLAYTVLGLPYHGHLALLMVSSSVFIALALSLGLLISTIAPDQQLAMFISLVGLLLPALIFSGFMFPLENMPVPLQVISHIIPTRWYFAILKSVMIKGLGISYVWKELLILIGMTLFLLTMAVKKFNIRLA